MDLIFKETTGVPENSISTGPNHTSDAPQSVPESDAQVGLANADHGSGSSPEVDLVNPESGAKSEPKDRPSNNKEVKLPSLKVDDKYRLLPKIDMSVPIRENPGTQSLRPSVMDQVVNLLQDGSKWDCKVYVGQHKFLCNTCVLQAYSPYFRSSKLEDTYMFRLPTGKVTAGSFRIIYKWMLYDEHPRRKRFSNRFLIEIYSTAKYLRIVEMMEAVWHLLEAIKDENEAFNLLPVMNYSDMCTFKFLCFSRISRFFLTLAASLEFVQLNLNAVRHLLSSHSLGVNSEAEIFYSAVRWLSYKWPERSPHLVAVMRCVRFGLLSPVFLRFLQGKQTTIVMHCISKNASVQKRIDKAFQYVSLEQFLKDTAKPLPCQMPKYKVLKQRRWIYDQHCPYHQNLSSTQRQFFSYEQFLKYLKSLHETGPEYWRRLVYLKKPIGSYKRRRRETGMKQALLDLSINSTLASK